METQTIICPKCGKKECTKDGIADNKQRYKCKSCHYRHTVKGRGFSSDIKRQALLLYLHGLCFRSIAIFLQCSPASVHKWIKSYGKEIDDIRSEAGIEIVKIDDMHSHIDSKTKETTSSFMVIDMENHDTPALCVTKKEVALNDGDIPNNPNHNS